jgi:hypothetical protein
MLAKLPSSSSLAPEESEFELELFELLELELELELLEPDPVDDEVRV